MKSVIDTRVSTGKQQENGVSLEAQKQAIVKYCETNQYKIVGSFSEVMTASTAARPQFLEALALAKAEKAALVVYSTSRFSRDTIDQLVIEKELRESGSKLISVTDTIETDTPQGEMMFTMIAAFNRMERRLIGERTKAALQYKKSIGERVGSIPHGYKAKGKKLIKDKKEQQMLVLVKQLRTQGYTLRAISTELESRGVFNRNGRKYNSKSIGNMLLNLAA